MIAEVPSGPGRNIQQARSKKTYEAFIAAGFKLLETHEWEEITIAGLAGAAGYSVGAFYARFRHKDEFFEAMVAHHLNERTATQARLLATASHDELVNDWIADIVKYYWKRRGFWRAVLMRRPSDPKFFAPIDRNGREFIPALTDRIASDVGRPMTKSESANINFAVHIVLSTINNRIVSRPRPSLVDRSMFIENLIRAFRLVSDYDGLKRGA